MQRAVQAGNGRIDARRHIRRRRGRNKAQVQDLAARYRSPVSSAVWTHVGMPPTEDRL